MPLRHPSVRGLTVGEVEHHERVLERLMAAAAAVEAGAAAPSHLVSEVHAAHSALDGGNADWQRLCWDMFLAVDYAAEVFLPGEDSTPSSAQREAVEAAAAPYLTQIRAGLHRG